MTTRMNDLSPGGGNEAERFAWRCIALGALLMLIGVALGIAEKTVKSRLHEARQRLGRALEPGSPIR